MKVYALGLFGEAMAYDLWNMLAPTIRRGINALHFLEHIAEVLKLFISVLFVASIRPFYWTNNTVTLAID